MKMKTLDFIKKLTILEILVLLSPFIDMFVAIGIDNNNLLSSLGVLVRGITIFVLLLYILKSNSKFKKISIIFLFLIGLFSILFLINKFLIYKNAYIFAEIKELIKYFYFPITFIGLLNLFDNNKKSFNTNKLAITSFIYLSILLISVLLGFGDNSYSFEKKGVIGIFYSPNEISALFGILTPITFYYLFKIKNKILLYLLSFIYIIVLLNIGTKVPLLALIFSLVFLIILYIIQYLLSKNKKEIKKIVAPIACIAFMIFYLFAFSPIVSNLKWQSNFADEKYEEKLDEKKHNKKSDISKQKRKALNMIFSSRDEYVVETYNVWKNCKVSEKIFGMGSISKNGKQNTVEIDIIDIFFNYGIVGLLIYSSVFIVLIIHVIHLFFVKFKKNIKNDELLSIIASIILGFGISFIAGHVVSAPSVSLMLSILLAWLIVYLININSKKDSSRIINFLIYNK